MTSRKKPEAMDLWFAFYDHELSLEQLKAQLKDLGWTDDDIDNGLDGDAASMDEEQLRDLKS